MPGLTSNEWVSRKWKGIRNSLILLAVAALAVGAFFFLHAWSFTNPQGDTGSCGSVVAGTDTVGHLGIAPETATAFCDGVRSRHEKDGVALAGVGVVLAGGSGWAQYRSRRALLAAPEPATGARPG